MEDENGNPTIPIKTNNVVTYDTISYSGILEANKESFGEAFIPTYNFEKAKTIVSVGADFMGNWLDALQYVNDYAQTRKPDNKWMSKHFQFEASMSLSGTNADVRVPVKPSEYGTVLSSIYGMLGGSGGAKTAYDTRVKEVVKELKASKGESIVICGSNDKNVPYESEKPSYKIKGLPFDDVSELKLIAGWDDDIHSVFAPYLTVFPYNNISKKEKSAININTAPREMLACLVPQAMSGECAKDFTIKINEIKKDKKALTNGNISKVLKDMMCYAGQKGEGSESTNPERWFGVRSSVFRIKIKSKTGTQQAGLEAVVRRIMPQDKSFGRDKQKTKRSYQILFWHMT